MKIFGRKDKDDTKPKTGIFVSVLNTEASHIAIKDFEISVAATITIILDKLKLPVAAGEGITMKYFLFRPSTKTADKFEILAEIDQLGKELWISEYGVANGSTLGMGAIMLPKQAKPGEPNEDEKTEDRKNEYEYTPDKDFEFEEENEAGSNHDEILEI